MLCVSLLAAGCATGERPSFEDEEDAIPVAPSGNPEIDTVLALLDSVGGSEFTAGYSISTTFSSLSSTGVVVQQPPAKRSITVTNDDRSVRFIIEGSNGVTCDLLVDECEPSINDARISDTQLSHQFYAPAFATRLRADAQRRVGDVKLYDKAVAGQQATCVDVVVTGGTKTYCALPSGLLAEFIGSDVTIELTSYAPKADASKFDSTA